MFFTRVLERISSTWRLAILQGVLLAGSMALCVTMASWALRGDLDTIARAVVLDDLGEYSVLYNRAGLPGLSEVFTAGKHEDDQGVRITTPDGNVLLESIPAAAADFAWPAQAPASLQSGGIFLVTLKHVASPHQLLAGCQLLNDGNALWFGRTNAEDKAYEEHIRRNLWLAGLGALGLALLPLWWFGHQVLRPVHEMMRSMQTLAEGRTDIVMAAPNAVPELRAFAVAYNRGLARIRSLTEELQSANDFLAHELRTPLARIRGNLEKFHDSTDNPAAHDAAARGLDEIDRATQLIHTILTIRAGENEALKLHLEPVGLLDLLRQLHDLYLPAADQRALKLSLMAHREIVLSLDRQRITQAIANLLDNALAYTPEGGGVEIALEVSGAAVRVIVRDTGPGLLEDELETIWQRNARGSAACSQSPGLGLGLSLVRAIAIAHCGSAGCANRSGGGAEFWLELPM